MVILVAREEYAEPAALNGGKVSQDDVAAVLERNRLVSNSRLRGFEFGTRAIGSSDRKALSVDMPGPADAEVGLAVSPDQGVVPVVMAIVLVWRERGILRLRRVVGAPSCPVVSPAFGKSAARMVDP